MSRKNKKRRYTQAQLEKKRLEKKQAKLFALQKNITIFSLLIILILGLVSTTFSTSIFESIENNEGALVTQVQTSVKNKSDLADTKANVDVANTGYDISSKKYVYYLTTWSSVNIHIWKDDGYYADYALTNIPNTDIWYHYFSGGWGGYAGFQFFSNNWASKSSEFKQNVSSNTWFTSNAAHTTLANMNGTAQVTTMISTDGGATWAATANSSVYTTVSGFNVASGATSATSVSANTKSSSSASISAAYGSSITYQANTTSAYTFKGFSTTQYTSGTPSYTSTSTTYSRTASANNGSSNTAVYAYYIKNPTATFKNWDGTQLQSGYVKTGTTPVFSGDDPERTGYNFTGWSPALGNITADTTYTAKFTPATYTVTLDGNGATSTTHTKSVTATYNSAMPTPITRPTKTGHTFQGYYDAKTGGTQYYTAAGASTRVWNKAANTTLYARWKANTYTVTLNAGGATINSNNVTSYTYGVGATLPTASDMTYEGYTFNGWYTNSSFTGNPVTAISTTTTGAKTYYAQWLSNSLTLTVGASSTSVVGGTVTVYADGEEVTASADGTYPIPAQSEVRLVITRPSSDYYISNIKLVYGNVQENKNDLNSDFDSVVFSSMESDVTIEYTLLYKPKLTFSAVNDTRIKSSSFTYLVDGTTTTVSVSEGQNIYVDYESDVTYTVTLKDNTGAYISDIQGLTTTLDNATATKATGTATSIISDIAVRPVLTGNKTFTLGYIDNPELEEAGYVYYVGDADYLLTTPVSLAYGTPNTVTVIPPQGYYAKIYTDSVTPLDVAEITYSKGTAEFDVTVTDTDVTYYVEYVKNPTISVAQPEYGSIYVTSIDEETDETIYYFNGDTVYGGTNLTVHIIPDNDYFSVTSVSPVDMTQTANAHEWSYQIFADTVATATISGDASYTDYDATDTVNQQATASKFDRVVFTYAADNDDVLSCSIEDGEDSIRYSFVRGKLTITPTSNNGDSILIKVTSSVTQTVKYYLIKISNFAISENNELQKIYALQDAVGITLSGKFSDMLSTIGYYVSEDNALFNKISDTRDSFTADSFTCNFNQTSSGVKYYKITAVDAEHNSASVTHKTVFNTDSSVGTNNFYLFNPNGYNISKYGIRVCFEKTDTNECSWASMQPVDEHNYRATIPYGFDKVSVYLIDADKHLVVKSNGANFNDICYYYVEDQITIDSNTKNTIYEMSEFNSTSGMVLQLLQ